MNPQQSSRTTYVTTQLESMIVHVCMYVYVSRKHVARLAPRISILIIALFGRYFHLRSTPPVMPSPFDDMSNVVADLGHVEEFYHS